MPMYTFYLCRPDGGPTGLEAFELGTDAQARLHAFRVLAEHQSCAYVTVWDDDRPVLTRHRPGARPDRKPDRPPSARPRR